MDGHTGVLQSQMDELQGQLAAEDQRLKALQSKRIAASESAVVTTKASTSKGAAATAAATAVGATSQNQVEKERLLADLNAKVRNVYELCGFDASSKPSTLFMLSQMESKLEVLLQDIERMPVEYVIKAEKEKEKRRREHKRAQQQAQQERQQEERNRRAIERSMQAPKKRNGPPVMYRSRLIKKETKDAGMDEAAKDNNDEIKFLS
jgi:hypothetical protein